MTAPKTRWPLADAEAVGRDLVEILGPSCERIEIAGSIRRRRPDVGDVELLCISRVGEMVALGSNLTLDAEIDTLIFNNVLAKRLNKAGRTNYGQWNKLMVHVATSIPVDIFSTTEDNWGMAFVVRTGPAEMNIRMMTRFRNLGMKGHAYGGVTQDDGKEIPCRTEERVFQLLGWPHQNPEDRV